ncbi:MAG: TatD family hydrolase [Bifidobacteriaceae bacterium]|jgi:TatD DNase family protein|nr:TatD family hydrolase [Bifidobacteriaceae bacterium]
MTDAKRAPKKPRDRTYPPAPDPLPHPVADNHTHIEPGQAPREAGPELTLDDQAVRAAAVGVARIVQCGCDLESARWTATQATVNPAVVGAIAIHPNEAPRLAARGAYEAGLAAIVQMAGSNPRVRAIGETGLDYFRTRDPEAQALQRAAFRDHIAVAKELGLAMQIHDRDAHADVIRLLERDGAPDRTVFHCFSGDRTMAELAAGRGWFVSVAGPVTFAGNESLRDAVRAVPMELLLVETDAPYLTSHPYRGRPNAPYLLPHAVRQVAVIKDLPLEAVCQQIDASTTRVYGAW